MSELFTNVKCPYCGHIQRVKVDISDEIYPKRSVVLCYPLEEGGCDQYFVVFYALRIVAEELKIEGFGGAQ